MGSSDGARRPALAGAGATARDYAEFSNEKVLFILNRHTGLAPYSHEFVPHGIDPQVMSGFVQAMSSFMGEVTGTEETRWETVYGKGNSFIVEGGEWSMGVMAVSRKTAEVRSRLRKVIREFEESYSCLQTCDSFDGSLFREFDRFVQRVFTEDRVSGRTVVLKGVNWRQVSRPYVSPRRAYKVTKFLVRVRDGQTVAEAAECLGYSLAEAKALISDAFWHNAVFLLYVPRDDDILELSEGASAFIFDPDNPLGISPVTMRLIGLLDGRVSLGKHLEVLGLGQNEAVLVELGALINRGYVQRVPVEQVLVLANECTLTHLLEEYGSIIGYTRIRAYLDSLCSDGVPNQPWVCRVRVTDDMRVYCPLNEYLSPTELDMAYDALELLINGLVERVSDVIGAQRAREVHSTARYECNRKWARYLESVTI